MLKIDNLVTPSPEQFEVVIKGMRLPFKSGDKSDSGIDWGYRMREKYGYVICERCTAGSNYENSCDDPYVRPGFVLGEKDKQLLLNLCKAGDPSHRKVLRQLPVVCDITAPLYWWKQMDQYRISTTTNSESTMHTMTKYPFKIEDFSFDTHNPEVLPLFININVFDNTDVGCGYEFMDDEFITSAFANDNLKMEIFEYEILTIKVLNCLRKLYLETGDKSYWNYINELLPQSYNQTRCWSGNYETLVNIINQRSNHKLNEWHTFCDYMLEHVPYLKEIYEAVDER